MKYTALFMVGQVADIDDFETMREAKLFLNDQQKKGYASPAAILNNEFDQIVVNYGATQLYDYELKQMINKIRNTQPRKPDNKMKQFAALIIILAATLFAVFAAHAQTVSLTTGGNFSYIAGETADFTPLPAGRVGGHALAQLDVPLDEFRIIFQAGYQYAGYEGVHQHVIPLRLMVSVPVHFANFDIGGSFRYLADARSNDQSIRSAFNKQDAGLIMGLSRDFGFANIAARYNFTYTELFGDFGGMRLPAAELSFAWRLFDF